MSVVITASPMLARMTRHHSGWKCNALLVCWRGPVIRPPLLLCSLIAGLPLSRQVHSENGGGPTQQVARFPVSVSAAVSWLLLSADLNLRGYKEISILSVR